MTIDKFLETGCNAIDGPINTLCKGELFDDIEPKTLYIPFIVYNKKGDKFKKGAIIEALRIGKSKYSYLYKVVSIEYPTNFKSINIKIGDVFSEKLFYTFHKNITNAKKDFDQSIGDDENCFRFNILSDYDIANRWYESLTSNEQNYVKLLNNY